MFSIYEVGVSGLEPEMPKPQIYSLLRFQFRSHTHENRRVLKTLRKCSVFPECQTGHQSFANLLKLIFTVTFNCNQYGYLHELIFIINADEYEPLNTFISSCQPIIVSVVTILFDNIWDIL